ncbi:MAG: tripartite tricarboxylate transporter permease [Salipiger thiooxidans]|uniref:tripartite tricarboxylate transporter permease n=1 Tax=Salipiger thiooxidans TaxID=282683 RepID=UPI001CF96BCA|nr:tripartite tricarboxylate transporter permease [Salipiger thiooxidans]
MELLANLAAGAGIALSWSAIFYSIIGITLGMVTGVLPGIGPLPAIAMLLLPTVYIEPSEAIIMPAGIYYGGQYGGLTGSILLNLPGAPAAAMGESGSTSTRCTGSPRTATASRSGKASSSSPRPWRGSRCR